MSDDVTFGSILAELKLILTDESDCSVNNEQFLRCRSRVAKALRVPEPYEYEGSRIRPQDEVELGDLFDAITRTTRGLYSSGSAIDFQRKIDLEERLQWCESLLESIDETVAEYIVST